MRVYKFLFAIGVLGLLFYWVDLQELLQLFSQLTVGMIVFLMLISVLLVYASALKWQLFLEALGGSLTVFKLFNLYLIGYFVNQLVPSYLGGDITRSWYAGKTAGQHEALAATVLERYTGFVAMLFLGLCFSLSVEIVNWQVKLLLIVLTVATVFITLAALSNKLLKLTSKWQKVYKNLKKVQEALHFAKSNYGVLLKAILLSLLFHCVAVLNALAAAYAVGWVQAPLTGMFVVLPIILTIGALPVTPSGLGMQEGAFYFFLQALGASPEQALGVALVLRAKIYVLALWGAVLWLYLPSRVDEMQALGNSTANS